MEPCGETADSFSTDAIREEVKDVEASDLEMIVAIERCGEIAEEKLSQLVSDKKWLELYEMSKRGAVPGFGKKVTRLLERQIARYEDEAAPYLDRVRRVTRASLVSMLTDVIQPAQDAVVGHHRNKAMKKFKQELEVIAADGVGTFAESVRQLKATAAAEYDEDCRDADACSLQAEWGKFGAQMQSSQFQRDVDRHIASVQAERISQIASQFEEQLNVFRFYRSDSRKQLESPLLFCLKPDLQTPRCRDSSLSVRKLLSDESELAAKGLAATLRGFELDKEEETYLVSKLRNCGRNALRRKAEFEARRALFRMKCRVTSVLWGPVSNSRTSTGDKDVRETVKDARTAALKVLALLAAIGLEDNTTDKIESALFSLLEVNQEASTSGSKACAESTVLSLLAANAWDGVAREDTLLTPLQCKDLWREFERETEIVINEVIYVQELSRRGNSSFPPMWALWAVGAMVAAGGTLLFNGSKVVRRLK